MEFNERGMIKGTFNTSAYVSADGFGVVAIDDDDQLDFECCATRVGQECWVFTFIDVPGCKNGEMVFVYIPEYGYATSFLKRYVDTKG